MSEEHDSWFKEAFGVDLGQVAQGIKDEASAVVGQVVSTATQVIQGVEGAVSEAAGAVGGAVKKVAGAVSPAGDTGGGSAGGGGTGSFPLSGSVGRGGKNAANDVRAVQGALGLTSDGRCGPQTIAAIEAFQRRIGQSRPDGRVDVGGATERAMASGAQAATSPAPQPSPVGEDDGVLGQVESGATALLGGIVDLGKGVAQGAGQLLDSPKSDTSDNAPVSGEGEGQDRNAMTAAVAKALNVQIEAQVPPKSDLITQLNELDDFRDTNPSPVPPNETSVGAVRPSVLANQVKEKKFEIEQLEITRSNLCKKARADARVAENNLKQSLKVAFFAPGSTLLAGTVATFAFQLGGVAMSAGGSLAMLGVLTAGIVAEHEAFRNYRDTLRSIVDKAHLDLILLNTKIAVERNRLAAMQSPTVRPEDLPDVR